ncbi:unnamed protein product [Prunus armeniaca]
MREKDEERDGERGSKRASSFCPGSLKLERANQQQQTMREKEFKKNTFSTSFDLNFLVCLEIEINNVNSYYTYSWRQLSAKHDIRNPQGTHEP